MFNADFYPTPTPIIEKLIAGLQIEENVFLEPSAGTGNIVDHLKNFGAKNVIGCENDAKLKIIASSKCNLIADDFLTVTSDKISHIYAIVMNPPFSKGTEHILHAFDIAPAGCQIRALINFSNYKNTYTEARKRLKIIVDQYGDIEDLGNAFNEADRTTNVNIGLIRLQKPGENYESEFSGFFLEEDEEEKQENGIISYNAVRDIVNRYVESIKVYDQQIVTAVKLKELTDQFYTGSAFSLTLKKGEETISRNNFKKLLQKDAWNFIISKFNLQKYATRGLKDDINKFVEQQEKIPFTMRNIYHMIDIIIGTASQRMDKSMLEVFDRLTSFHADNKQGLPGWKTNSHFLLTKRFIFPHVGNINATRWGTRFPKTSFTLYQSDTPTISDLEKTLCFLSGENYDEIKTIFNCANMVSYGEWHECHFFKYKGFKKGTLHVEFKSDEIHAKFNQQISRIKGYPLFEGKKQTPHQDRQTGRSKQNKKNPAHNFKPTILFEI